MTSVMAGQSAAVPTTPGRAPLIGFFDSGVGGLAVLGEVARRLPHHRLVYYADTAHFPYGGRTAVEIVDRAHHAAGLLIDRGAEAIVVACNTASTAALTALRQSYEIPFVGVVPAVKPAASISTTGSVAILATEGTLQSRTFDDLVKVFAADVNVMRLPGTGLADQVERGALATHETFDLLERCLVPARARDVDVLVLGCTHYSFLRPAIEQVIGPSVTVIDCVPAVVNQVVRVVAPPAFTSSDVQSQPVQYVTSGDPRRLSATIERLMSAGADLPSGSVLGER